MTLWGPITDGADVEAALIAHLKHWMPSAAEYVKRHKDPDAEAWPEGIAEIREYGVSHADAAAQKWPEDQLPMLIAQSPGMEGPPLVNEGELVEATYGVMLSAIVASVNIADAKELARLYASAARLAIMQHPDLAGAGDEPFASHVAMGAERNGQIKRGLDSERNLMVCTVPYLITVEGVLNVAGGPQEAPEDPTVEPDPDPTVKEGGGSAAVDALTEGGFFDQKP